MTVRLGNDEFPGGVLTMPWDEVHRVFLARVRERPLQGEDSTTIIEGWTYELQRLRGEKQSSPRCAPKRRRRR